MSPQLRVLMIAHGHPDFSKGGAEHAAYHLYEAVKAREGCDAWFLGRHGEPGLIHTGTPFALRPDAQELLFNAGAEHFDFSNTYPRHLTRDFAEFLQDIQPDVVHFHHYVHLGIEMIRVVRNVLPRARIILTLHEYLGICNNNGQMIKTNGQLCSRATPAECHLCMPGRSQPDFFLRELYIKSFFGLVDAFVSPSEFLKQRYVAWGLAAERIHVIENGLPEVEAAPVRPLANGERRNRFAYFGQITPFKGLEVLLDAFERLPSSVRREAQLDVHGGGQHHFTAEFQERIKTKLERASRQVHYYGPYTPRDLPKLIGRSDWLIIPSTWWENSPLVIQESYRHGRPLLCSDIGGMAEKVPDRVTGLHFRVGNPDDLAERIREAIETDGLWDALHANIRSPIGPAACLDAHLPLYRGTAA